jgi:hypothetical protein
MSLTKNCHSEIKVKNKNKIFTMKPCGISYQCGLVATVSAGKRIQFAENSAKF